MSIPKTTVEQWAVLASVVDAGGFAQAAKALNRSQSAVSYTLARLQELLDLPLLAADGRRAVLTPNGRALLGRARAVMQDLGALERVASSLKRGWEPALALVIDAALPRQLLLDVVRELQQSCPDTQLQLSDAVLSGAEQTIVEATADVVVTSRVPPGHLGEPLIEVTFVAVAAPTHPLVALRQTLTAADLLRHRQCVVRDSGTANPREAGWLGATQRSTVSSVEASLAMVEAGLGYAWLPADLIAAALASGRLVPLPLESGVRRGMPLSLVLVHADSAGPAARAAADCFLRHARAWQNSGARSG